jgi:hypothetical protein
MPRSNKITASVLDLSGGNKGNDSRLVIRTAIPEKKTTWPDMYDAFKKQWKDKAYTEEQYKAPNDKLVSDYNAACQNQEYRLKEAVPYVLLK